MKILVTGGAGYIGSHAVLALTDAGYDIAVLDNLETGFEAAVPKNVPLYRHAIQDKEAVTALIKKEKFDTVMHFAASVSVPESVTDPLKYYKNNTANAIEFLQACEATEVARFIFSSTAAVYGPPENPREHTVTETSPTAPISPYGLSKLLFERVLSDFSERKGVKSAILRYFNVSGADPYGRAGQRCPNTSNLFKCAIDAALGKRPYLEIFGTDYDTPDGTGMRDFIHVSDLADIHVAAAQYLQSLTRESDENVILLNCGYGRGVTVGQTVTALKEIAGEFEVRYVPRREGDIPALITATKKLNAVLKFNPRYQDVKTILSHAYEWDKMLTSAKKTT